MSSSSSATPSSMDHPSWPTSSKWSITPYKARHTSWPYTTTDFSRSDESPDSNFYGPARLVTHIDDNAIKVLGEYYDEVLPRKGRILDLCSSWVSHFPKSLAETARITAEKIKKGDLSEEYRKGEGDLEVIGLGMNKAELEYNPILSSYHLIDLNSNPSLPSDISGLKSTVCVVSIDYLIKPLEVLKSINENTEIGGDIHLILSNRCFPTKAIKKWLHSSETERPRLVGDYLYFSGWEDIEIIELVKPSEGMRWMSGGDDPLWVVRGRKKGSG